MDAESALLLLHGAFEGIASLVNMISPTTPWDQIQPPVAAKFLFGGVFSGAVLAISTLFGPRPIPRATLLTLATMHIISAIFCVPGGPGYPKEGIDEDWDTLVSTAGMVIHGVFGISFTFLYTRSLTKLKMKSS